MKNWTSTSHQIDSRTTKVTLSGNRELSVSDVLSLWSDSSAFRTFFTETIIGSAFEAYFWETPPVTTTTLDRPFEFVLVESGSLALLRPDPGPFEEYFLAKSSDPILTFPNLGGDAILVVPAPLAEPDCYPHLARFLNTAPPEQIDLFWQAAGRALKKRISSSSVWLSTAGMGVSWLHLRLDSRPKYYRHQPYACQP